VGVGTGIGCATWGVAFGTETVTAGVPCGVCVTRMLTAVPCGSGVSSLRTKLSLPALSCVSPAASCPTTLASTVWPSFSTSASMLARASFTAASAGSCAGGWLEPVSWAMRAASSDMRAPCAAPG
jgi:hypothetical protein